jgi:hypothetical protein
MSWPYYEEGMSEFGFLIDKIRHTLPQEILDDVARCVSVFRLSGQIEPLASGLRMDFRSLITKNGATSIYKLTVSSALFGVVAEIDWPVQDSLQLKRVLSRLNVKWSNSARKEGRCLKKLNG